MKQTGPGLPGWPPSLAGGQQQRYRRNPEAFAAHLAATYGLTEAAVARIAEEFLDHWSMQVEDYVRSRHLELREEGLSNQRIFLRLQTEIPARRFSAGQPSLRQIRRMIYG